MNYDIRPGSKVIQEAQLPQKNRAFDIAVSYGATKLFDLFNRLKACASVVSVEISLNLK